MGPRDEGKEEKGGRETKNSHERRRFLEWSLFLRCEKRGTVCTL